MSNKVFVGNIQYQTTQEELQELFNRVGESRFDLHHDKLGKPSGYGFCEFKDPQAAALAIEKFNGLELNGRALNVGYPTASSSKGGIPPASSTKASIFAQSKAKDIQRQAPMKAQPGSVSQKVNNVMDSMSTAEIYDIMMAIKEDPESGRRHLQTNPSLAYALLQAQVILGFIPAEKATQYFVGAEAGSSMMVDQPSSSSYPQPASSSSPYPQPSASPYPPQGAPAPRPAGSAHSLAELVRMDQALIPQLGLDEKTKKLVLVVHKVRAMPPQEFERMTVKQKEDLKNVFTVANVLEWLPGYQR